MARPKKQGLDYFPLDVNVDTKIEILESKYGILGFGFIIKLFQKIYANGYYLEWNQYSPILLQKEIRLEDARIIEFINFCLDINIFDKTLYEKCGILTSKGIQKRYFTVCKRRKEVEIINEYLLVNPNDYGVNVNINSNNDNNNENMPLNRNETNQETENIKKNNVTETTIERN